MEASQELFSNHPPQHGHVWTAGSTKVAWKHRADEASFPAVGWGQWAETTHDVTCGESDLTTPWVKGLVCPHPESSPRSLARQEMLLYGSGRSAVCVAGFLGPLLSEYVLDASHHSASVFVSHL